MVRTLILPLACVSCIGRELLVFAGGDTKEADGHVSVLVKLVDGALHPLRVAVGVSIVNQSVRLNQTLQEEHLYSEAPHGKSSFVKRADLLDETKGFVLNDTVTFEVNIMPTLHSLQSRLLYTPIAYQANVLAATAKLLESGLFSDVTLVVEGQEICAHKAILAAHSPVFKAMFEHKMSESLEGKVMIDDIRTSDLREFIR